MYGPPPNGRLLAGIAGHSLSFDHFGPPSNATRAKTCPPSYSPKIVLEPDAEFNWPLAPVRGGGHVDLRHTPEQEFGQYTAQLLDPELEIAFIAACNP